MTLLLTEMGGLLKRDYMPRTRSQVNSASAFYHTLPKDQEPIRGEDLTARLSVHLRRSQAIEWLAENVALPVASNTQHNFATVPARYIYGRIGLTGQAIVAAQGGDTYALASAIDVEMEGMGKGLRVEVNVAAFGDGSGRMAQATIAAGTTVAAGANIAVDNAAVFEPGMEIVCFDAAAGGNQATNPAATNFWTIATVDVDNNRITLDVNLITPGAPNWGGTGMFFRRFSRGNVMMGLRGAIDGLDSQGAYVTQTFQGISRATESQWRSIVRDNNGVNVALTLPVLQQMFDRVERVGQGRISHLWSSHGVRNSYVQLLIPDVRYQPLQMKGGWSYLAYSAGGEPVEWYVDRHCRPNTLFGLDMSTLGLARCADFSFFDIDGHVLNRVADRHSVEGTIYMFANLYCSKPNSNFVWRDITES